MTSENPMNRIVPCLLPAGITLDTFYGAVINVNVTTLSSDKLFDVTCSSFNTALAWGIFSAIRRCLFE